MATSIFLYHVLPFVPQVARIALLAFAAGWLAVLVHELGHALAASALGVRLWGVRLGIGPVVYEGPIGGIHCRIAWFPLGGMVQLLDADADALGYRDVYSPRWQFMWVPGAWRAPIISAAGPIASLVVAAIFTTALASLGHIGDPAQILRYSALANLGGWLNLLPLGPSDGLHVLRHMAALKAAYA